MAIEENDDTKNPKTRILRKMLDKQNRGKSILSMGITGNEMTDIEEKIALDDVINPTETFLQQDVAKWLTTNKTQNHKISNGRRVTTK
jgi:hypothetical protein